MAAAAAPATPLDVWKRLEEFEAVIEALFPKGEQCPVEGCPPGPRVHLVYAHHLARPDLELNVSQPWHAPFDTLKAYDKRKEEKKPRSHDAAMDFLAAHFLWVRRPAMAIIDGLPQPPLQIKPIPPTIEDGGTLVDFINRDFPAEVQASDETVKKQGEGFRRVKIITPAFIDPPYIERYRDTAVAKAHARTKKDMNGKTLEEDPNGSVKKQPAPLPASAPDATQQVESGNGYPRRRRLCLSLAGQEGDHKDVDLAPTVSADLAYHIEISHIALRLFCVSPMFKFEFRSGANPKTGAAASAKSVLGDQDDPWKMSTRQVAPGPDVWETTSSVWLGTLVPFVQKNKEGVVTYSGSGLAKAHGAGLTTTKDLGDRFAGELGACRRKVFEVFRHVEGPCEAINTYDVMRLSWGINQWAAYKGSGELVQILAYIYDFFPNAFARRFGYYGIGVWFKGRSPNWDNQHSPYQEPIAYRIPCCGHRVRDGIKAVLEAPAREAPAAPADLPPRRKKYLADATRIAWDEWASFAMAYVFTTAGADPEIQKAMAQWMSYRITTIHPGGKTLWQVIWEFQLSLESPAAVSLYADENGPHPPWVEQRRKAINDALRADLMPDAQKDAENDAEIVKLRAAVDQAKAAKPPDHRKVVAAESALKAARVAHANALADKRVEEFKKQPFSDDDADEAWIRWPTRCTDAGKSMTGNLIEQETFVVRVKSDTKADTTAKGAAPAAKGATATTPGAPATAKH